MKIYTRTGDRGSTSLLGGKRVSKSDVRIDAYGTVDELSSYLGLLADHKENGSRKYFLKTVQEQLFSIGSILAVEPGKSFDYIPEIDEAHIKDIEKQIDKMNEELPEMRYFILPGGHTLISFTHIARCVCRRAERSVALLMKQADVEEIILKYLNRLSDYLFVLSRKVGQELGVEEKPWKPREKEK